MTEPHFTESLPRKRSAADCLIMDRAGRLLVLKPSYKEDWDLPGGVIEEDESPLAGARREVREELGLDLEPGRLLAVDWIARAGDFTEVIAFLFDGGTILPADIDRIVPQPAEVITFRFVTPAEAGHLLDAGQYARVTAGLAAREQGSTAYLENGLSRAGSAGT
ncbi:NUDIX domain-containing protein [Microlunatus sp. GCM10028923]|uniref:NUDIX domain-containing protein n=1 Tax=Microlunatus sp. GCM10028923 TaxID=3273400 RepID=UPI00360C4D97